LHNKVKSGNLAFHSTMEEIIKPIDREVLKAELTPTHRLRHTSKSNNDIYVVTWQDSPNVVKEIGRLREIAFRAAGGGTGKCMDLDEFDTCDNPYRQLIVWNPESEEILGGYRFFPLDEVKINENGQPILATSHMFHFSDTFMSNYMNQTIELGRSFVTLEYQNTRHELSKSMFALDNLWEGLGALTVIMPNVKYLFGKMTMYPSFSKVGRDMILFFLNKHFCDAEDLITPTEPLQTETDTTLLRRLFTEEAFKDDYRILNSEVRKLGYNIPPLVNAYMGLSPTMKVFGTAINEDFGMVEETGILIDIDELFDSKRKRYIDSFADSHPESIEELRKLLVVQKK